MKRVLCGSKIEYPTPFGSGYTRCILPRGHQPFGECKDAGQIKYERIAKAERAVIRAAVWIVRQWKLETVGGPRTPRTALGRAVDRLEKAQRKK